MKAWFWQGVPAGPALAVVAGAPYTGLWPGIQKAGKENGGLRFVSPDSWKERENVGALLGPIPADIGQHLPPGGAKEISTPYSRLLAKIMPKEKQPEAAPTYVLPKIFPFRDA